MLLKDCKIREIKCSCFESVTCFLLTHPGKFVTKNRYEGNVEQIDPTFLRLLDRYCERVFTNLDPKRIYGGRELLAAELPMFMKAYINMFSSGAVTSLPGADSLLEATATANNTNAVKISLHYYNEAMNRVLNKKYIRPNYLESKHQKFLTQALKIFDKLATIGDLEAIEFSRMEVVNEISEKFEKILELNNARQGSFADDEYMDETLAGFGALLGGALALGIAIFVNKH